jgi:hypothetical protein
LFTCFLNAKGETATEIHSKFISVYGEDIMNRQNVAKWCNELESGRMNVYDEKGEGGHQSSLIASFKNLKEKFALIGV